MIQAKCIQKFRNKQNRIYGYRLVDANGQTKDVDANELKTAISNKQIQVVNLALTSDGRIIDNSRATGTDVNTSSVPKQLGIIVNRLTIRGGYDNCKDCEVTRVYNKFVAYYQIKSDADIDKIISVLIDQVYIEEYDTRLAVLITFDRPEQAQLERLNYETEFLRYGDPIIADGNVLPYIQNNLYRGLTCKYYSVSTRYEPGAECEENYAKLVELLRNEISKMHN